MVKTQNPSMFSMLSKALRVGHWGCPSHNHGFKVKVIMNLNTYWSQQCKGVGWFLHLHPSYNWVIGVICFPLFGSDFHECNVFSKHTKDIYTIKNTLGNYSGPQNVEIWRKKISNVGLMWKVPKWCSFLP